MREVLVAGLALAAALIGCSSSSSSLTSGAGGSGGGAGTGGAGSPSAIADTNPANPHVTKMPPASPNAPFPHGMGGAGGNAAVDGGSPVSDGGSSPTDALADSAGNTDAAATTKSWPTSDCVGGPCAAPNVCVNLDFLYVACVPCGGNDQVCCPPYGPTDPWLGTCDPGLTCGLNPNFHDIPPLDLVYRVCQVPGSPPPSDGGFNHQRQQRL